MKILIARMDKIGDMLLTLPMEEAWREAHPGDEIIWLADSKLNFIFDHAPDLFVNQNPPENGLALPVKSGATFFDRNPKGFQKVSQFYKLYSWLRSQGFEMAVAIQVPLWVAMAFWLARIPVRRGVASKWYSWVFFNQAIRQKRSLAEKSEAQYNIDLLQIKNRPLEEPIKPVRILPNEIRVQEWKQKIGESFVLIHPGMAGSARNWPALNYKKLAEILLKNKMKVVVSGSKGDLSFIHSTNLLNTPGVISIVERTPPEDLLAVISLASVVVAPSTGVAHLGASLNKKVIGIYSPVRVQRPQRWGPLGDKARTLIPDLKGELCPGQSSCLGARCKLFDCMEEISVDRIANAVLG